MQRGLNNVESVIEEYVKGLAGQNDAAHTKAVEDKLQLLLGRLSQQDQKREQGTAGLWGKKRQDSTALEEEYDRQGTNKEKMDNEPWNKRAELSTDQRFGKAGIWGKRQTADRIMDGGTTFWEARELQKPPEPGLWGKRARKQSFRLEREASKINRQPDNIGLWTGKRGEKVFNKRNEGEVFRKRVQKTGKTNLWRRSVASKERMSGRKRLSDSRRKTAYVR